MANVLGPRSIYLQWNPPTMPNGILTNYTLRYSNATVTMSVELEGTATNFTADNLNEDTMYFFQLNASTRVGYGPAAVVDATTNEDGKTAVFLNVTEMMYTVSLIPRSHSLPDLIPDHTHNLE